MGLVPEYTAALFTSGGDHGVPAGGVGHVVLHERGPVAERTHHGVAGRGLKVGRDDERSFGDTALDVAAAHALRPAGDDHRLPVEHPHRSPLASRRGAA